MGSGKRKLLWLLALLAILAVVGMELALWRNHVNVLPPPPPEAAVPPITLPATTSNLSVSIRLPNEAIAAALEDAIPKTFPFDTKNGARVYGSPSRGPITVTTDVAKNRVVVSTRVAGRVHVEKTVVVRVSVGVDVSGTI